MSKRLARWFGIIVILAFCVTVNIHPKIADALSSNSYQFDETVVGAGGLNQSASNSYQGSNSTGDLVVGNTASGGYQIDTGSKTTPDPALSFTVTNAAADFSTFSPTIPSTATSTFSVSNYTSFGYIVQIFGTPPTNGTHTIAAMSAPYTSTLGIEQFGINLVANHLPVSVGANPDNGQFGFGSVTSDYNTDGTYRFVSGDSIASAPKSSGVTNYTISYLVNVSSITQGGQYTSNQTIIITGTY